MAGGLTLLVVIMRVVTLLLVVDAPLSSGWFVLMSTQLPQLELVRLGVCFDTWCSPISG